MNREFLLSVSWLPHGQSRATANGTVYPMVISSCVPFRLVKTVSLVLGEAYDAHTHLFHQSDIGIDKWFHVICFVRVSHPNWMSPCFGQRDRLSLPYFDIFIGFNSIFHQILIGDLVTGCVLRPS